jgi:tripartite-type tricarboxylate transporter receptor subunit TctC
MRHASCQRYLVSTIAAGTMLLSASAIAQDAAANYPSRTVTIISPFVPGGSTDNGGRLYTQKLTEMLGKPFVLDFKPGAGATLGTNYVARATPDGHTLLITTATYTISAATYKDLPYDPLKDLAPVTLTLKRPTLLMVHPSLPINNYADYMAYVKAYPGKLNFGTSGAGGS